METAGVRGQPETCAMAYAIVSTVSPNASDTPSSPMPTDGKAAAMTALPHPAKTSQKVPMNSAARGLTKRMVASPNGTILTDDPLDTLAGAKAVRLHRKFLVDADGGASSV